MAALLAPAQCLMAILLLVIRQKYASAWQVVCLPARTANASSSQHVAQVRR
jgi:hypothetical protein